MTRVPSHQKNYANLTKEPLTRKEALIILPTKMCEWVKVCFNYQPCSKAGPNVQGCIFQMCSHKDYSNFYTESYGDTLFLWVTNTSQAI